MRALAAPSRASSAAAALPKTAGLARARCIPRATSVTAAPARAARRLLRPASPMAPPPARRAAPLVAPAVATATAAATATVAAAAAAPELTRFLLERLATVIAAPTLAALAVIALTDLLARQAERLIRARSSPLAPPVGGAAAAGPAAAPGVAASAAAGGDLAPLLELELAVGGGAAGAGGGREEEEDDDGNEDGRPHPDSHPPHPASAFPETLALLPLALRGPTRVVLLLLVATRALRGLLFIADEAVHTFKPTFGPSADRFIEGVCSQLQPLDGALVRLYSAAAVLFLTWVAIRLKTLLVARYLRGREAEASRLARERRRAERRHLAELAANGGGGGGGRSSSPSPASPSPTPPPPVDLVRLLLPLDEAASWLLAVAGCLLVAHNQLGLNLSALVAVGGAGSLVVALGTQQLVSNAVSGLNILLSAPFVVGESVTLVGGGAPMGGISGVVEQVSVVRSRLRTDDDVLVEVPNAALAGMIVYNRSRTDARTRAPTDRLVLRVPLRVRVALPPPPAAAAEAPAAAAAPAGAPPVYQRCADALRGVLEGPLARGLVEPNTASVVVLRLGEGGGLELLAQAMVLRDKRAEDEEQRRRERGEPASAAAGGGRGVGVGGGGIGGSNGRARVAELLSALAAVAQREGGRIVQMV